LSNAEQRDSWLNSGHWTLAADKDVIHHGLEGGRAVGHAKKHYQGFEQASIGPEGCLPLVSRLDTDVVEIPTDIQLGKVSGSTEL